MGKYFDGKRFNYIKTGDKKLSDYAIRKLQREGSLRSRVSEHVNKLGKSLRKRVNDLLENYIRNRHSHNPIPSVGVHRQRKANIMGNSTSVKKQKKDVKSLWRKLVNGVGPTFTRSFTAIENRARKLYEFLDDV